MSYHIVSIDTPHCSLSCKDGQLTCRVEGEPVRSVPLEDVASIIVTSFSASVHSKLLVEAARHGVALIICEAFQPISLVLPANRSTDTILTRAQINLSESLRHHLWQKTVNSKCQNQLTLARVIAPDDPVLAALSDAAHSKKPHKESICAKMFWEIYGRRFVSGKFTRARAAGGINHLLNYGYAVLLSTVLQKLLGVGLDPTFGIHHAVREHATPLAYDLMEPFRPCVDWRVGAWLQDHPDAAEVTKEFRKWVTGFPLEKVDYFDLNLDIQSCIEGVARGFRRAVIEKKSSHYRPWIQKSLRWAG